MLLKKSVKLVVTLLAIAMLMYISAYADGINSIYEPWQNEKLDQKADKQWTIQFNREINTDLLAKMKVFVATDFDGNNKVSGVEVKISDKNAKCIVVSPPNGGWTPGGEYYLFILSDDTQLNRLKKNIRMRFTIIKASENSSADIDTDGDGLSDFQELNKYFTDPNKKDSDDDGVIDSDWNERTEYTYTIKTVMKIIKPWNTDVMNDDYQDVKVLFQDDKYLKLETIYYPLNTNAKTIKGNANWKEDYKGMTDYLKPGITTNWDENMQEELIKELNQAGIYPDKLTDKELVQKVSKWILSSSQFIPGEPSDFYVYYPNGVPTVHPELRSAFDATKYNPNWTDQELFERELLGKQMFYNKQHGSCSSSSIYWATVFRALGIPTRIISTVPSFDGNDQSQVDMVEDNITNNSVKSVLMSSYPKGSANHFYNEVYVGNHWVRLNYDRLGANTLDKDYMGLLFHLDTFKDFSEIDLAENWGRRLAGLPSPPLSSSNPYQTFEISDSFGGYSDIENPDPTTYELTSVHIDKVYAMDDPDLPSWISYTEKNTDFILSIQDWVAEQNYSQLDKFFSKVGHEFILKADGCSDVRASINGNNCSLGDGSFQGYAFNINSEDIDKMKSGVKYKLYPVNVDDKYKWIVNDDVIVERPSYLKSREWEIKTAHINGACWKNDSSIPSWIIIPDELSFVITIDEWLFDQKYSQLDNFQSKVDRNFILKADGQEDIKAYIDTPTTRNFSSGDGTYQGYCIKIDSDQLDKMKSGVKYTINPVNSNDTYKWVVNSGIFVIKP